MKSKERKSGWREPLRAKTRLWAATVLVLLAGRLSPAQTASVSAFPDADSFVRSLAPAGNYGGGGALSVSGATAVNGLGERNGLFDTLMRFPMSNVVASLDGELGEPDWVVIQARLVLTEMAVPDNAIFNRGVGTFEIRWLASDGWVEGTGRPNAPAADGVTWQDLPQLLNSNLDMSLGVFTNSGVDGQVAFNLVLAQPFITDMRQGVETSFYLTAQAPEIGFTFNSRNFGNTNAQPTLSITAALNPRPRIDSIALAGTNAFVSFGVKPTWSYRLQASARLASSGAVPGGWSDLLTIPPQLAPTNVVYADTVTTNQNRFYRLSVSQ